MNDILRYASRIKKIGNRIKTERESQKDACGRKMSQEKLAEEISSLLPEEKSVGQNSVSNWEKGNAFPPLEKLICMAQIFHCDVAYLLCDYDDRSITDKWISETTGLSVASIGHLKNMQERVKREKAAGWYEFPDEQELTAINTLLECGSTALHFIYQYLYGDYNTYWMLTQGEHGEDKDICADKIMFGYKGKPNGPGTYIPISDARETFMLKIQRELIGLYNLLHWQSHANPKRGRNNGKHKEDN